MKPVFLIADMPERLRPREKMLSKGPQKLTDDELLALLLGSGAYGKSAIYLARELLLQGGLVGLANRSARQLCRARGMGVAKATRIAAAFELARRAAGAKLDALENEEYEPLAVGHELVKAHIHHSQERMGAFLLDARNRIIRRREDIFRGTLNHAPVSVRDIAFAAFQDNAAGVVLWHNHPSGDWRATKEDHTITARVFDGLRGVGIDLVDHLIVGAQGCYSFANGGEVIRRPMQASA